MKKEGLKKRLTVEKNAFPNNSRPINFNRFLITVLVTGSIIISNLSAQTPLNGFCRFHEFAIPYDQTNFSAVDYTFDGYRGFITFNNSEKKYTAVTYNPSDKTFNHAAKYLSFTPSRFKSLGETEKGEKVFAYTSRKDRIAGKLAFSKKGSISIISKIKFDSYPENLDVGDIDNNGKREILISGPAFNGLSILKETKKILKEEKIVENGLFEYAAFIDLDYDSYLDIAAVDVISKDIRFFYNDRSGDFIEQRSVKINADASEFSVNDFNSDGFMDFVFIQNGKVEALLGDSVSSYQKSEIFDPGINIDKYKIFDYNGDGFNDIAFLNSEDGIVGISFAESISKFYPQVIYFRRKGIIDLTAYVDRGGRKLGVLDKNGSVYLIDKVISNDEDFTVAAGQKPGVIGKFDYLNDRAFDLFVLDGESQHVKFYLSARSNLFNEYYDYNLFQNYSRVEVDDIHPNNKTFYFYSTGDRIIEIVRANFTEGVFSKRILYTDGPIEDLKLTSDRIKDRQTIYVLVNSRGRLSMQTFNFHDFRYMRSALDSIAVNVSSAAISLDIYKEIFFYTKYDSTLYLNNVSIKYRKEEVENISSIPVSGIKNLSYGIVCFGDKDSRERPVFGIVSKDGNTDISVLNRGYYKTINIDGFTPLISKVRYFDNISDNELFLYDNGSGKLKSINLKNNFNMISVTDIFEYKNINSYIAAQINNKKELLIYTGSNNLINFKTIQ